MDDQQAREEMRKRMRRMISAVVVGLVLGVIVVPLRHGQHINPLIAGVSVLFTLLITAGIVWVEKRMGVFDSARLRGTGRMPGEGRLQWYQRLYTAEPRHDRVNRIFIVCGALLLLVTPAELVFNRPLAIGSLVLGSSCLLTGGAEYLPRRHRRNAAIMRIAGMLTMMSSLPFLYWELLQ